jgi:4-hydroxy-tetrahydrodipicolinate synthase
VAETARELERAGVSVIPVAVPRLFNLPERDLFRYFDRILSSIEVPLLIQDFNPVGPTIGAEFICSLHKQHAHFKYVKLEEPLMSEKVCSIVDATSGEVGVLAGWGGVYVLELMRAGICGLMPGLAVSDALQMVWKRERQGDHDGAYSAFMGVLPQITYSLQSLEFYHHAEKALLVARGVLPRAEVRDATLTVGEIDQAHIAFLNRKVMEWIDHLELAGRPSIGDLAKSLKSVSQGGQ